MLRLAIASLETLILIGSALVSRLAVTVKPLFVVVVPIKSTGSATQVMRATRFRATVGQKQPPQPGDQQQPGS